MFGSAFVPFFSDKTKTLLSSGLYISRQFFCSPHFHAPLCENRADATKITLAPSNADMNQGENVTLQCHASHDPTMDLTFTWALNGVLLDLEDPAGPYHRVEGVRETAAPMIRLENTVAQNNTQCNQLQNFLEQEVLLVSQSAEMNVTTCQSCCVPFGFYKEEQ